MATPAIGSLAELAMDAALPFDVSSEPFEFLTENLRMVQSHVETGGIRGTRSRSKERVRIGREQITGSINMNPSPTELNKVLERIMGGTPAVGTPIGSTTFPLGETLPEFQVMVDRKTKVFTYEGCRISRATFRATQGGPLEMQLDIEGETESVGASGTFPAIAVDLDDMFILSDCALVLAADASATQFANFELVIDNLLDTERYMNSVTRAEIPTIDRLITLSLGMAYTVDEVDLYDQAIAGAAGSLTFTNGTRSLKFDFANLKAPAESPVIAGKGEILLPLRLVAYKSGATAEMSTILDSTA